MNNIAEELWRYNSQERQMMLEAGIQVIPEIDPEPYPQTVPDQRTAFQKSFMQVIDSNNKVTDGNGNAWRSHGRF